MHDLVIRGCVRVAYDETAIIAPWRVWVGGQDPLWLSGYEKDCLLAALSDADQRAGEEP